MKLTIERGALLKAMGHAQGVVERRNTIPILSNVLIEAEEDGLRLTATDLDLAIEERIAAKVATPGATTAPAQMLYDIARKLPDGAEVEFSLDGENQRLTIAAGRSRFALGCLPREDFPVMSSGDLPHSFRCPAKDLKRLIDGARFAISTEETRYYLNGVYLHAAEGDARAVLRAVATDGHRLARIDADLPEGAADMPGVIAPRKTVQELRKLIDDAEGEVEIAVSDAMIRFACGDVVLISKLIDGTFPDYQRVIPTGNDKTMEIDGKAFADAVDRVATVSSERSRAVKLAIEADKIVLSVTSAEAGSATEELSVDYGFDPLEIGFNARYLLDIMQQIDGATARFEFLDSGAPTIARDAADPAALYVLMPMRV